MKKSGGKNDAILSPRGFSGFPLTENPNDSGGAERDRTVDLLNAITDR